MPIYTLEGKNDIVKQLAVAEMVAAAEERERQAVLSTSAGKQAPDNIWDMGTSMWQQGANHLPSTWVNTTIPEDLKLTECPTFNMYRAIVEQIQGGILSAVPDVEFGGGLGELLDDAWRDAAERSNFLAELDLCIAHNCNYGQGWLGIHIDKYSGKFYFRAVHPQLIIHSPAERPEDIAWLAKLQKVQLKRRGNDVPVKDVIKWPDKILTESESGNYAIRMEVWVREGSTFANRRFDLTGIRATIGENYKILRESDWPLSVFPIVPVYLLPSERMIGDSLAVNLWQAQVRVDKILAIMLARAARSAGEKYAIEGGASGEPGAHGSTLIGATEANLKKPGVQVVSGKVQMLEPPKVPRDLIEFYMNAIRDMERLAGISPAYQGMAPKGARSGVAIRTLAEFSSKRVNRMAGHLAGAVREFAKVWARMELSRQGQEVPDEIDIEVNMKPHEEKNRQAQFTAVIELARAGVEIPPEMLVEIIPNLSTDKKAVLLQLIQEREEIRMQQAQQEQGAQPGSAPEGQQPDAQLPPEAPGEGPFRPLPSVPMNEGQFGAMPGAAGQPPQPLL